MRKYTVKTFYAFCPLPNEEVPQAEAEITKLALELEILGLMIMGKEGINTTLACYDPVALDQFITFTMARLKLKENSIIKTSHSGRRPFKRFDIKIRAEIVTLGNDQIVPEKREHKHISPEEWHKMMLNDDVVVLDTRNDYEVKIGKFKDALDLDIKEFRDLPEKLKALDTDREKPHLIYCTGGIRCEKAIYELENQGFKNVYQLDGGILNYLEKFPNELFKGECFVFDARVALDQKLEPSEIYALCPHCGDTATLKIECLKCDYISKLCETCHKQAHTLEQKSLMTCSKNCKHHYELNPDRKGPHQRQYYTR